MNRNYIHDIKPSTRTQKRREALHRVHERHAEEIHELEDSFVADAPVRRRGSSSSGRGVWWVAATAIIILVFALTFVFAGATVFVTPRTGTVELSGPILAQKEARQGLTFEMMTLDGDKSESIEAGEKKYVEKKATGKVRIYNNNSSQAQKLLIDTRLESPAGYIYKTKVATTVPGQHTEGGKLVPGSVEVEIYADAAGEAYNLDQADLKIVGFRGSPKYEKFYARTVTAISGGFKGEAYDVSDEDLALAKTRLQESLKSELLTKAEAELPETFIMYDDVSVIDYDEPVIESGTNGSATIKIHANLNAVLFKETELTKALIEKVIANTEENKVTIPNIRELKLTLDPSSVVGDPSSIQNIKVIINDKINVVWEINEEELKETLSGIKKRDFETRMLQFKNIDKAELNLKPFWKNTLPEKPSAIKIVNALEAQNNQ